MLVVKKSGESIEILATGCRTINVGWASELFWLVTLPPPTLRKKLFAYLDQTF